MVLGNHEDAEDIASEAIARALAHDIAREALASWLTTTTKRLIVDEVRGRDRRRTLTSRLRSVASDASTDPIEQQLDNAEAQWLATVVERLPRRQREAIDILAANCELAAVAQAMGVSYKAAEHLVGRARASLRLAAKATWGVVVAVSARRWERRTVAIPAAGVALTAGLGLLVHSEQTQTHHWIARGPATVGALQRQGDSTANQTTRTGSGAPGTEFASYSNPYRVAEQGGAPGRSYVAGQVVYASPVKDLEVVEYGQGDEPSDPVLHYWGCVQHPFVGVSYTGCDPSPDPAYGDARPLYDNRVPDLPLYPRDGMIHPPPLPPPHLPLGSWS